MEHDKKVKWIRGFFSGRLRIAYIEYKSWILNHPRWSWFISYGRHTDEGRIYHQIFIFGLGIGVMTKGTPE